MNPAGEELRLAAVGAVRRASEAGRLIDLGEVLATLEAGGFDLAPDAAEALVETLPASPGIESFESLSGRTVYHAPDLLSATYARILDCKNSPVELMAGEIRLNSRDYPRPVPVELFEAPPFDLSPELIENSLKVMAASPDYQDITFTTTPSGAVYLFSSLHLEREFAEFLAERAESLSSNP